MPARTREGFSLIELLVALAVLSVAVVALLNLAGESTRTAASLEERALAAVVAENRAVEAVTLPVLTVGEAAGEEQAGGRTWRWVRAVTATADAGVVRIDVRVSGPDSSATLAEITAFRSVS